MRRTFAMFLVLSILSLPPVSGEASAQRKTQTKKRGSVNNERRIAKLEQQHYEALRKLKDVCFSYGLALLHEEKYKEAIALAEECIQSVGEDPYLLRNLGAALRGDKQYAKSQETYRKVLAQKLAPDTETTILEWYLDLLAVYDPDHEKATIGQRVGELKARRKR